MIKMIQIVAIQNKIQKWLKTHPDVGYESISIEKKKNKLHKWEFFLCRCSRISE